jgi:hypothetical protein
MTRHARHCTAIDVARLVVNVRHAITQRRPSALDRVCAKKMAQRQTSHREWKKDPVAAEPRAATGTHIATSTALDPTSAPIATLDLVSVVMWHSTSEFVSRPTCRLSPLSASLTNPRSLRDQ